MQTTANLGLKKPEGTDVVNIQDFNDNADLLDTAVAAKETLAGAQAKANTAEANAKGYTDTKIAALIAAAPGALDTLKELADALGDNPNFATTITNLVATKADQATVVTHLADTAIHATATAIREDETKALTVEVRSTDPTTPEVGRLWLRSDL